MSFALLRVVILTLVYGAAVTGYLAVFELHPLVIAWCVSTLTLMPVFLNQDIAKIRTRRNNWMAAFAIFSVIALIFIILNDPLWVKRSVSVIALFELVYLLLTPVLVKQDLRDRTGWDSHLFLKGRMFQFPVALMTLFINEIAIWTNDDWWWISAQALRIVLLPLVYVLIANISPAASSPSS
ncbi:MAG: hypothetical protein ABJ246_01080 [Paracoccaceae bacterium]